MLRALRTKTFRWLLTIVVLFGIGIGLSFAVTWCIVLLDPFLLQARYYARVTPDGDYYLVAAQHGKGRTMWTAQFAQRFSDKLPEAPSWLPLPGEREAFSLTESWGWPRMCLMQHGFLYNTGWEPDRDQSISWRYGIKTYQFPTKVIWSGAAANASLFGVGAGLLCIGLVRAGRVIKRWRRKRKGMCPRCGYDVSGLCQGSPCPECGTQPVARGRIEAAGHAPAKGGQS